MNSISRKLAGLVVAGAVLGTGTVQAAPLAARLDTTVEQQTAVEKVGYRRHYRRHAFGGHRNYYRGYRGHRRGNFGGAVALGALGFVAGAALAGNAYGYGHPGYHYGPRRYYGHDYGYYPRRRVVVKHVYHSYHPGYGYYGY